MSSPVLGPDQIEAFLKDHFPEAVGFVRIVEVDEGRVVVELDSQPHHLRPGGTVSGPTLMALADTAMYFLVLSLVGPVALAVTTNLNINFLRRPTPGRLTATATLLKLGRTLVVGEVHLRPDGEAAPVAHATVTYALPPNRPDEGSAHNDRNV